jgi:hypothetical protein
MIIMNITALTRQLGRPVNVANKAGGLDTSGNKHWPVPATAVLYYEKYEGGLCVKNKIILGL